MFLTKKTGNLITKTKNNDSNKPKKALAGWEDDDVIQPPKGKTSPPAQKTTLKMFNLLQAQSNIKPLVEVKSSSNKQSEDVTATQQPYFQWDELNENNKIQCEKRLVEQIVQPGGIRIKPNQSNLSQFLKECKSMEVSNIGSLLLSKLEVNYPFIVKAKALYTIEFIAKKDAEYLKYFKFHATKLSSFPQPQDSVDNYRKIHKSIMVSLGLHTDQAIYTEEKSKFVDPGYYQQTKSQLSNFIQQNSHKPKQTTHKKAIIGPGQVKVKANQKVQKHQLLNSELVSLSLNQMKAEHKQENLLEQASLTSNKVDLLDLHLT